MTERLARIAVFATGWSTTACCSVQSDDRDSHDRHDRRAGGHQVTKVDAADERGHEDGADTLCGRVET